MDLGVIERRYFGLRKKETQSTKAELGFTPLGYSVKPGG